MPRKITGVHIKTVLDDRKVTVVFRSPYRWRILEDARDVTKEFGFSGRRVEDEEVRKSFYQRVESAEISSSLQVVW